MAFLTQTAGVVIQRELWCADAWSLIPLKFLIFWSLNPSWKTLITVSQDPLELGFQFADVNHFRIGFSFETCLCDYFLEIVGAELLSKSRLCIFSCHQVCHQIGKVELEASCLQEAE